MDSAPVGNLTIRRTTPNTDTIVEFADGSTQSAQLHNQQNKQLLYVTQETVDAAVLNLAGDGVEWDAEDLPIKNVGTPVDAKDAVTKQYADTIIDNGLSAITNAKNSAVESVEQAEEDALNAINPLVNAAALSAGNAFTSEQNAYTSEQNAYESEQAAAQSAEAAATFDPDLFLALDGVQTVTGLKTINIARQPIQTVSTASTVTLDLATANRFEIELDQSLTIGNPSNAVAGQSIMIILRQDATGSRLVSWGSNWKFPDGTAPTLSTDPGAIDVIVGEVTAADEIICNAVTGFA